MPENRPAEFRKLLVPIDGSPVDDDAICLAASLGRKGKARIYVVSVIKVEWTLPLDAESQARAQQAEAALARAEALADEMDCEVETQLLQAREVGPAIVDEAVERGVDVIVLGMSYKKKFGEFTLGEVAPYVLKNSPCPVLVFREPMASPVERPRR